MTDELRVETLSNTGERTQENVMHFVKSSIIAAALLASIVGANAQGREGLNSGIHGASSPNLAEQSQSYTRDRVENFRDAYASGHKHGHNVRQTTPANPTLENIHGGPAR
jgi:hypothetical protein